MADLIVKRYQCPSCGYLILKVVSEGDEGYCPLAHDQPERMEYKGEVKLTTV